MQANVGSSGNGPIINDDGEAASRTFGMATHGTEPKPGEAQFPGILDAVPDAILIVASDGRIVQANSQALTLFGYTREELQGQPIEMLLPDRFKDAHCRDRIGYFTDARLRSMNSGLTLFGLRKDGVELPVEIGLSPLETEQGMLAVAAVRDVTNRIEAEERRVAALERRRLQDISERKTMEEALEKSETLFRTLAEVSPVGIFLTDTRGECTYVNARWCEMAEMPPEEAMGTGWTAAIDAEDLPGLLDEWAQAVGHSRPFSTEHRLQSRQGKVTWVLCQARPHTGPSGDLIGYVGTMSDITERKQVEEALRTNESRLRVALTTLVHSGLNPSAF
jgi:PAS domain S-box-containing protein